VVFASEVKSLLASGWVEARLDAHGLDELMTFWAPLAPRTVFEGVLQVPPGEMVILEGERLETRKYWDWTFPERHERGPGVAVLQEQLRSILGDATELRLRADVPVGAYLSGGLDSSSLVSLLEERVPQ